MQDAAKETDWYLCHNCQSHQVGVSVLLPVKINVRYLAVLLYTRQMVIVRVKAHAVSRSGRRECQHSQQTQR